LITAVKALQAQGAMERGRVDGVDYVWPVESAPGLDAPEPRRVRLLAPFDPLVWDRRRLEHLWGWKYRFEAYTPVRKRIYGYYALPVLWGTELIGWANASVQDGALDVQLGYREKRPRSREYSAELEREVEALRGFLGAGQSPMRR
jgi:uncharacterized protein YcaQ